MDGEEESHELQTGDASLGDFHVHFRRVLSIIRMELGNGDAIRVESYKDFVRVNLKPANPSNWEGSKGLLGSHPAGYLVARDGVSVMGDTNEFGQEWQVRPYEAKLFHDKDSAEPAIDCVMPDMAAKDTKRRLGESTITMEDTVAACARVGDFHRDSCIFDVLATNDKDMAGSY